jgi:hypothetical protein
LSTPLACATLLALGLCGLFNGGCGATQTPVRDGGFSPLRDLASSRRVGQGPRFTPPASGPAVQRAAPVDGMSCGRASTALTAVHVEVFAQNHVVVIPAGIGVAPPLRRAGAYVRDGRCLYPLRTLEPTGLVEIALGATHTLGELFRLWGQPLTPREVAGFAAAPSRRVAVFVNGRLWPHSPRSLPLTPHAQITVEVGPHVPPHARYTFPTLPTATHLEQQ